jgi:hypothetical protein
MKKFDGELSGKMARNVENMEANQVLKKARKKEKSTVLIPVKFKTGIVFVNEEKYNNFLEYYQEVERTGEYPLINSRYVLHK